MSSSSRFGAQSNGAWAAETPLATDAFQRAVLKPAPKRFTIEFLPATKLGSAYYFGLLISARSSSSPASTTSLGTQYDIWRTWEDCLWLQNHLEGEYKRAARERRTRLAQGKGVKTLNGIYKLDIASSFESLPPGPEPTSIASDVHAHIPLLTKKNPFFAPKAETIERQAREFQAFMEALMSDDMPSLIREIRATRDVTDFFGYWRRDIEFEKKLRKHKPELASARQSRASSIFSSFSGRRSSTSTASIAESTSSSSTGSTITQAKFNARLQSVTERSHKRTSSSSESSAQSEECALPAIRDIDESVAIDQGMSNLQITNQEQLSRSPPASTPYLHPLSIPGNPIGPSSLAFPSRDPLSPKSARFSGSSMASQSSMATSISTESSCHTPSIHSASGYGWSPVHVAGESMENIDHLGKVPLVPPLPLALPTGKADTITLKVSLNKAIVLIKVAKNISYEDLRQKIYHKYVNQEGMTLSESFDILEMQESRVIDSDEEWKDVSGAFEGTKLQLMLLDSS